MELRKPALISTIIFGFAIPNVEALPILTAYTDRTAWETARAKAELVDFRFHDLRHSAASYLAMNGASPLDIAAVLGHKSLDMVKRYAHLSDQHTAGVVERMNEKKFGDGSGIDG